MFSEAIQKWVRFNILNKGELLAKLIANDDKRKARRIISEVNDIYNELKSGYVRSIVKKSTDYEKYWDQTVYTQDTKDLKEDEKWSYSFIFKYAPKKPVKEQCEPLLLDISAYYSDFEDIFLDPKVMDLKLTKKECPECGEKQCTITIEEGKAPNHKKKASLITHCGNCNITISEQDIRYCMENKHLQDDYFSDLIEKSKE